MKKHLDDIDELCADIEDDIKDKDEELKSALEKARRLKDIMDVSASRLLLYQAKGQNDVKCQ